MKDRDTPLRLVRRVRKEVLVRQINEDIPGGYRFIDPYDAIDMLVNENEPIAPDGPRFCDRSIVESIVRLVSLCGGDDSYNVLHSMAVTACYLWRKNKSVFSFDDDLSRVLTEQVDDLKDTDVLPSDILTHPPYPCTFVKTNVFNGFSGFWYWVWQGADPNVSELYVVFVAIDMENSSGLGMKLLHGRTIRECWDATLEDPEYILSRDATVSPCVSQQCLNNLLVAMQFILYLASENADVQDVPQAEAPRGRKKRGQILDKASEVKEKAVGVRIGNAIRKIKSPSHPSSQGGTGTKVRPHSRRGHWHHYWTGPRDGDRKLVLKWTAPTFIHIDEFRNDTVVVYPVRQEKSAS